MKAISVREAREFDRRAQEVYGIPSLLLMENAGRSAAEEAVKLLGQGSQAVVVCGIGNNGGDGLVAARHLLNAGKSVAVLMVGDQTKMTNDARTNLAILRTMAPVDWAKRLPDGCDLIIDALLGIGLNAPVAGAYLAMIDTINRAGKPVLSVDVPSGLNADTGEILGAAVRADKTVTFAAVKNGLLINAGPACCGAVVVRDIGLAYC